MRLAAVCVLLTVVASTALATTPVQDGTVNGGEYAFQSGNWSMAWDDTYLYVARTNISGTFVIHLDVDALSTPVAGTNASGNKQNGGEMCCGATNPYMASLPFRSDGRLMVSSGFHFFDIRNGSGGWTSGTAGDVTKAVNGTTIELRILWAGVPGTSSRPASFNWLAYDLYADGLSTLSTNMMPATNTPGATRLNYFFNVWDTSSIAIPTAFSDQQSTWIVQTAGDSGTGSLRQAITDANADATSTRRFITFDVASGISTTATLPFLTRTVTIDGTTQGGFSTEPIVVVTGPGANSGVNGIGLGTGSTDSVVRGLVMQSFATAIAVTAGSGQKIVGNWIGLDGTGMAAAANSIGILAAAADVTIGGAASTDRNVISGNSMAGISILGATNLTVVNNYIGTNKLGTTAVANASGILSQLANANVIGGETSGLGNVISGNSGAGIEISGAPVSLLTIKSNKIGVGADGTTAIGNGAQGIHGQNNMIVGTNTIANNGSTGVTGSVGPIVIRANSIYSNSAGVLVSNSPPLVSVTQAAVNGGTLTIQVSASSSSVTAPTQSMQLDLYNATGTHAFLATSPCYAGSSLSGQTWSPVGTFNTDPLKVMVTAFSDVNCTTYGDGTSNETTFTPQNYSATTTTTLSGLTGTLWTGTTQRTLTATVSGSNGTINSGTVAFTDNSVSITGCESVSVSNGSAVCTMTIGTAGQHSYVGTYSGSIVAAGSTSSAHVVTAETHTFTGSGLFADTARWSQSTVPLQGEDAIINGACTVVDETQRLNTVTMANGASVTIGASIGLWAQRVVGTGSSTIDLGTASGSALLLFGNGVVFDDAHVTLIPGTGTFFVAGQSVTLPALAYYRVQLFNTAVVTSIPGTAIVNNLFTINPGGSFNTTTGTLDLRGGTSGFGSASSIIVPNLIVASGAIPNFSGLSTFTVTDTLTVNGSIRVGVGTVSGGTLTGSGTIQVAKGGLNPLQAQYAFTTRNLTNLTVTFATQSGQTAQTIDPLTYKNLTIDNTNGVTIASDVTVAGTLDLKSGVATLTTGSLHVTNSSTSAITRTSGRLVTSSTGLLNRAIATGSGSYLYPLGLASEALDVTLTPSGVTGAGNVGVRVATGNAGSGSGIDTARDVNLRWTIANQSASGGTYSAALAFGTNVDGSTTPSAFVVRAFTAAYSNVAASGASASSITGSGIAIGTGQTAELFAGNQLGDHLSITAGAAQTVATSFLTTATLQDVLNVTVGDASGTVTFGANSGNVQYDSNGDGTWGDNTKALSGGAITILTRGMAAETVTLSGSASAFNGSSSAITFSPSSFGPPLFFAATAASTSSVSLSWTPVAGATSYKIYRSTGGAGFALLTSVASTSHTDSGLSANTTYLYRVSAATNSTESATTATDPATTVLFTDTSLSSVVVRAYHLTELRTAVNAMRIAAGLGATTFTDNTLSTGATVKRLHITELRTALDQARSALVVPALSYGEAITAGATSIKASHVTELRAGTE